MTNGVHSFTGHRPERLGGYGAEAEQRLIAFAMEVLVASGTEIAVVGMALGWDQAVADACVNLDIPFVAAVPFHGQESRWPLPAQKRWQRLLDAAQDVKVLVDERPATPNRATAFLMHRNDWMVANSTRLQALWNGDKFGGTASCISTAKIRGIPITNHWPAWVDPMRGMFEDILGS